MPAHSEHAKRTDVFKPTVHGKYALAVLEDASLLFLAKECLRRLPADVVEALSEHYRCRSVPFSTLCSGTDAPALAIKVFTKALSELWSIAADIPHTFACEFNAEKRHFILRSNPGLKKLFHSIADIAAARAFDAVSQDMASVDSNSGTIAGFPCQDASFLNSKSASLSNRSCIAEASHRTGAVFHDILAYLQAHPDSLEWTILENVLGLAAVSHKPGAPKDSNLDVVVKKLESIGFVVQVLHLCPTMLGRAHARPRLYLLCIKATLLKRSKMNEQGFSSFVKSMTQLLVDHPAIDVDAVLLPEHDSYVQEHMVKLTTMAAKQEADAERKAVRQKPPEKRSRWVGKHINQYDDTDLVWCAPHPFRDRRNYKLYPGTLVNVVGSR